MAAETAFQAVAPRLAPSLSNTRATCKRAPCCSMTPCPGASLCAARRAFVSGGFAQTPEPPRLAVVPYIPRPRRTVRMAAEPAAVAGERALRKLLAENAEFVAGRERTHADVFATRAALVSGQAPPVAVIACSDSRTPPETVFRSGLGELFVMRVAGNTVMGDQVLGSIQYGVDVLGVKLLLVLGHTECGAITAACARAKVAPVELSSHVDYLVKLLEENGGLVSDVNQAVEINVKAQVALLEQDLARRGVKDPPLVRGAVLDIASGKVSLVKADVAAAMGA